jgi:hypothetical protein
MQPKFGVAALQAVFVGRRLEERQVGRAKLKQLKELKSFERGSNT